LTKKFEQSQIITDDVSREKLFTLCEFRAGEKFELVYSGSRDGFGAADFHAKCDDKSKTLTIVKASQSGNIFGGYTEAKWNQIGQNGHAKYDPNAFLFSLVNNLNRPVKMNIEEVWVHDAIWCETQLGPLFGENDFFICDNSNICNESFSSFGQAYRLEGYVGDTNEADCFLAGSKNFTVEKIEVFQKISSK
jgi:hypothetical protein